MILMITVVFLGLSVILGMLFFNLRCDIAEKKQYATDVVEWEELRKDNPALSMPSRRRHI